MAQMMKRRAVLGFDGLTPAFASVMALLDLKGSRATLLAQKNGVTKQATSQLLKLLAQRDYVEQVADPTDTRAEVIPPRRLNNVQKYLPFVGAQRPDAFNTSRIQFVVLSASACVGDTMSA
jgi:hypothetical protein